MWESIVFIIVGWALSTVTTAIVALWVGRTTKRATFTKLYLVIEEILVSIELVAAWRAAGGIETTEGLFDIDESHLQRIPPRPPSLPKDFGNVVTAVAEWESAAGKHELTKRLQGIKFKLGFLSTIHAGLRKQAELRDSEISPRALAAFQDQLPALKADCTELFATVYRYRRPWYKWLFGWVKCFRGKK